MNMETTTPLAGVVAALHRAAALAQHMENQDQLEALDLRTGIELAHAHAVAIGRDIGEVQGGLPEPAAVTVPALLAEAEEASRRVPVERHPGLSQLAVELGELVRQAERLEQR